MINTELIKR